MNMVAVDVCALEANSTCKLRSVIERYMIFGAFNVHGSSHNQAATDRAPRCASTCWRSSFRSCTCPATPSPSPFWASNKLKRSPAGKKLGLVNDNVPSWSKMALEEREAQRKRGQVKERGLFQGIFFFPTHMVNTPIMKFSLS